MEPLITRPPNEAGEKTLVRDISWCGVFNGANASMVDVKDGKIVRIRPARYYDQYTREEVKPWVMHARGRTFEPSDKSLIPPLSLAYKKRVFSPARIRYPMKRVDFDPKGERNPQNRGVSKYERISWDEALDIIVGEMVRIKETYGPTAILNQSDQHGENKCVHGPHGCMRKLLTMFGGYTLQIRDADSWEGWWWGAKHAWGCEPVGPADASEEPALGHLQEHRTAASLGVRPRDHRLGLAGPTHQPPELLVDRAGDQADLHRARRQLRQRGPRRQVDPHPAQHRRRPLPRDRPRVVQERHLRQGVPRDPRVRGGQVRGLRHGPRRRPAQERRVGLTR